MHLLLIPNGALGAYLVTQKALPLNKDNLIIKVEQGYVMNWPSEIIVKIMHQRGTVTNVQVGGCVVIMIKGLLFL